MIETLFYFLIPIYVTNASSVIAVLFPIKHPIDFKKKIKGKRVLGNGKTIEGTLIGLIFGMCSVIMLYFFNGVQNYLFIGTLLCIGSQLGDIVGSFVKRRIGLKRGEPFFILDQLDFLIGASLFSIPFNLINLNEFIVAIIITMILHKLSNLIAFKIRLKKVPW